MLAKEHRRKRASLLVPSLLVSTSILNVWPTCRTAAFVFLLILILGWVLNLTVFSPNRKLPRDKVPKHPLGLDS